MNNIINKHILSKLFPIIIKLRLYDINLISEILSIRIFLFLIISLSVFVLEPYVIYKLGLKYAFERIKLPVYRTFIKYSTFYSAKYSEFF